MNDPGLRRKLLIDTMTELESRGMGCMGCEGTCCTYQSNSMMVTPLEALELLSYLKKSGSLDEDLKAKCSETVSRYRLDHESGNGRRSFVRKTYTCPFFGFKELGCPLPREVKPYGCLAFNAHHETIKASDHCYSDLEIQKQREAEFAWEDELNLKLKEKYQIFWNKSPLPTALLDLWEREINDEDLSRR